MPGARIVTASETESRTTWSESQIKEMTGNEAPLSARDPYGKPFTFWPQFKLLLVGNHAPKLKGRSPAMERRLRIVPFNHVPDKPDLNLKEKLKAEYPAIFRRIIDGCVRWQKTGLGASKVITAATSAYFEAQDAFKRWQEECCIIDKSLSVKPAQLLSSFNAWAKENSEDTASNTSFAELIDQTEHLTRGKSNGERWIKGIGLKPKETPYHEATEELPLNKEVTTSPPWKAGEAVITLHRRAFERLKCTEKATVWMETTHPKLGMKKPMDVCQEPGGMERCLSALS
jgi:putative DNA primase/helicase